MAGTPAAAGSSSSNGLFSNPAQIFSIVAAIVAMAQHFYPGVAASNRVAVFSFSVGVTAFAGLLAVLVRRRRFDLVAVIAVASLVVALLSMNLISTRDEVDALKEQARQNETPADVPGTAVETTLNQQPSTSLVMTEPIVLGGGTVTMSARQSQGLDADTFEGKAELGNEQSDVDYIHGVLTAVNDAQIAWANDGSCDSVEWTHVVWAAPQNRSSSNQDEPVLQNGDRLCVETAEGHLVSIEAVSVAELGNQVTLSGSITDKPMDG